jgi:predicted DNA-binding ribbon-helix-helix protein
MPFSLKLRPDTLEYIYAIANDRNIPLAQVIEELVDTHSKAFPRT